MGSRDPGATAPVDLYVAPTALGTGSGASPENAAAMSGLNALIAANSGATIGLLTDQGIYGPLSSLALSAGNVTLQSWHPTNPAARAVLDGGRAPFAPGSVKGNSCLRLNTGANNITFRLINCQNVGNGLFILGGIISNLHVSDVEATNLGRFLDTNDVVNSGVPTNTRRLENSSFKRITAFGYERGFSRLNGGSFNVLFEDIDGDSDFNDDVPFTSPFATEGTSHDITYRRVFSRNVVNDAGSGYWNGDGFSQEEDTYNILYVDCTGQDTSDGGFDLKGEAVLDRPRAIENKRNYRLWLGPFTLNQPYSENPILQGGSADAVHFGFYAAGGTYTINDPIVVATPGNLSPVFKLDFNDSTVTVNGHDNITLIEGQPLVVINSGVTGSEVIFDPPLPTIGVSLVWRAGFEAGDVPRDTAVGTAVADVVTTGTSPATIRLNAVDEDGFVLVGNEVRVGADLEAVVATSLDLTVVAHHPGWLVSATVTEAAALVGDPPVTLATPIWSDDFNSYADGTRLVAGDPNANWGGGATNPGNLGYDAITVGTANNARFNPIVVTGNLQRRTANTFGDNTAPGSYVICPPGNASGNVYFSLTVQPTQASGQTPSLNLFATDNNNRLRVAISSSTTGGGSVAAERISGGTTTGLSGANASASLTKPRMGGTNGQFRGWQASETITALAVDGKVYLRRAPGFPLGSATGTAFTALSGERFGFDTFAGNRTNFIDGGSVGPAPLFIAVDTLLRNWVPKKRASSSDPITAGVGDETFTGTYVGNPSEFWGMEWALATHGNSIIIKDFELADRSDLTITPTGANVGTWSQRLRSIPVGINGRGAYALVFRPIREYLDPEDGLVRRTDPAWQCASNNEFYVTHTPALIGQSTSGGLINPVTITNYPRADGIMSYTKADPPSLVRGSYSPNPQIWNDTSTTGANGVGLGRCTYVLADYLADLYDMPVAVNVMAIGARGAAALGPGGADWDYIQTHNAFAGSGYDWLYLSQGENEFGDASGWLVQWRDTNIPAYRDPAMHGQPAGTVIPILYTITGRYAGTPDGRSDAAANLLRQQQYQLQDEVDDCFLAHSYTGIDMIDNFHYSTVNGKGYNEVARRIKLSYDYHFNGGAYDGRGPVAVSAVAVSDTITDIIFDLNGATSLVARDGRDQTLAGNASALTSWQVSTDDFSSNLTISSAVILDDKVRVTHSSAGTRKVRNHYGLNPDISSFPAGSYADGTFICMMPLVIPLVAA